MNSTVRTTWSCGRAIPSASFCHTVALGPNELSCKGGGPASEIVRYVREGAFHDEEDLLDQSAWVVERAQDRSDKIQADILSTESNLGTAGIPKIVKPQVNSRMAQVEMKEKL